MILFHHVLGLTTGVTELADRFRAAGHTVHTPDLFDGHTFESLDDGIAHAQAVGFGEIVSRGVDAAERLPAELVYAGISAGVMPAQRLAQTRPGARAALLLEACVPPGEFGGAWPDEVPVQIHGREGDPFFADEGDVDAARALAEDISRAELFLYPGDQHLFTDSSLPSYDEAAVRLLVQRALPLLG